MNERLNSVLARAGIALLPQASNPIPLGMAGRWMDTNNVQWEVSPDGTQTPSGSGAPRAMYPTCRLATAAALSAYTYAAGVITASVTGAWTIDGKTLTVGDRILVKDGAAQTDNGIYVVTVKGSSSGGGVKTVLTRASDMATSAAFSPGALIPVGPDGNANAGNLYELVTNAPITMDTTGIYFAEFESISNGVVPAARLAFSVNPSNNDTITIAGSSFTFKTSLGAATTTTQVLIGASAAATLADLLNAINGVADANVVPNTTPFALSVVADAVTATVLRLRKAISQGGNPVPGTVGSTTLAASITTGASAWSCANLNASGRFSRVTITSGMISNGSFQIELPFTPSSVAWTMTSSAGVLRSITDAITISGNAINVALAGGASPATQAGDLFNFTAAP